MVSLGKSVTHKLKILVGGKIEYCKSIEEKKKRGGTQGGTKGRGTIFDSDLVGGNLGGNYDNMP